MNITEVIDLAILREREAQDRYLQYVRSTQRTGFRQLLLSMVDMEKIHEKKLAELKARGDLGRLFPDDGNWEARLSDFLVDVPFTADMEYGDFLLLVIKKEEASEKFYEQMATLAREAEPRQLFSWLAEEERKHKAWAQDRYDLDILKDN